MNYSFIIKKNHPALRGHFPNNPIVPGVVILDEVIRIIEKIKPDFIIKKLLTVKFLQPLLPEQDVNVEINQKTETSLSFCCSHNNIKLASGQLTLEQIL